MNPSPLWYALAYLFWIVTFALAMLDLVVVRSSAMIVLGMTPWNRYVEHALNQFGFLLLAMVGLAFIIFTEHFYRTGVEKGRLFSRFFLVTCIGVLILALAHLVQLIGEIVLGIFTATTPLIVAGELAVCAILFWLHRRFSPQAKPPLT